MDVDLSIHCDGHNAVSLEFGKAVMLLEQLNEIAFVVVAEQLRNPLDGVFGMVDQRLRLLHLHSSYEIDEVLFSPVSCSTV